MKKIIIILIINLGLTACTKEDIPQPEKSCYTCQVITPGIKKSIDTCVAYGTYPDFKNSAGISLPWSCVRKN